MKNRHYCTLVIIALLTTSLSYGITEQQTLESWETQYNNARSASAAINTLKKFHNRKTPASQKKFNELWDDFLQTTWGMGFTVNNFDAAQKYYFALGRFDDLYDQAEVLLDELEPLANTIRKSEADVHALEQSIETIKLTRTPTKDERKQLQSQTADLSKTKKRFNVRKSELEAILYGKGSKKAVQDLGLDGFLARFKKAEKKRTPATRGIRLSTMEGDFNRTQTRFNNL